MYQSIKQTNEHTSIQFGTTFNTDLISAHVLLAWKTARVNCHKLAKLTIFKPTLFYKNQAELKYLYEFELKATVPFEWI